MATFFVDFEGGNDTLDGLTFANRWKTFTSGATAARIAPGDTIRSMGSLLQTNTGVTGLFTDGPLADTVAITSSTNAAPIVITQAAHGRTTGDTSVVTGHTVNTNANGTWELTVIDANTYSLDGSVGNGVGAATGTTRLRNNTRIKLSAALTKNIASCQNRGESLAPVRSLWVASTDATAVYATSNFKCSDVADSIAVLAAFTTGKAAYFATGVLDLSLYQGVSFWVLQFAGTAAIEGDVSLRLCSDTAGATTVHTISIGPMGATGSWKRVYVNTGAALGAAIQSVALYVDVDRGAQTFIVNNIIAIKANGADNLNLASLIGKNTAGETWAGIQSINGTRVMLDMDTSSTPTTTTLRGYSGTTETVAIWKRETIKLTPNTGQTVNDSGTENSFISYQGGWDRTDMSVRNLETWLDGQNGTAAGLTLSSRSFVDVSLFGFVNFTNGLILSSSTNCKFTDIVSNNNDVAFSTGSAGLNNTLTRVSGNYCTSSISAFSFAANTIVNGLTANNNAGSSVQINLADNCYIYDFIGNNNAVAGIDFIGGSNNYVFGGSTRLNKVSSIINNKGSNFLRKFTMSEAVSVSGQLAFGNSQICSEHHNNVIGDHRIFTDGGTIRSETVVRDTASGISWALPPTSANRSSLYPLSLPLVARAVNANALVTVKAKMLRTSTALTMQLVCKGGQIAGVTATVSTAMTAAIGTWQEVTITFTPTEAGIVQITAEAWGGTSNIGYVDNMTFTQA